MQRRLIYSLEEKDGLLEETNAQNTEIMALYEQMQAMNQELTKAYGDNEKAYVQTIKALAYFIEAKDQYTKGHSDRVLCYAEKMASALKWDSEQTKQLKYAAILHDIGKIAVSQEIINKPGRLTNNEFEEIKRHPYVGYKILKNIHYLETVSRAVLEHHERVDGQGYPNGLKDDDISIMGKVLAIADAFDAMTSDRSYRKAVLTPGRTAHIIVHKGEGQNDG